MTSRILDSSVLISFWKSKKAKQRNLSEKEAAAWARELVKQRNSNAIVSPVYLEFLAGATRYQEIKLFKAFLTEFQNLDNFEISVQDWKVAQRYAEKVPRDGKPRQLGDCLVKALADRFRRSVDTLEKGFPA